MWTNTAAYNWSVKEHDFNALIGTEASRYDGEWLSAGMRELKVGYDSWQKAWLSAGNETGYFLFGGSDIVLIFQRGVEVDALHAGDHVLMGEAYARLRPVRPS